MKLYFEKLELGNASNISFYTALEAYYNMGFEVIHVSDIQTIEIEEEHIFLGSINYIHSALRRLNITVPKPIDYPEILKPFLGRKIWKSTINKIANNPKSWNVFVKPYNVSKKFTGRLIQNTNDLIGCGDLSRDTPIWVSEPVDFIAEWRVFVRYNRIIGVKPYRGDWRINYDAAIIEKVVDAYTNAPAGYSIDFGRTSNGDFLLIEVNDGYSLGSYGLFYVDYAKLLSARWAELTNQRDLCDF